MKTLEFTDAERDDLREAILSHLENLISARRTSLGLGISVDGFDKEIDTYRDLLEKLSA